MQEKGYLWIENPNAAFKGYFRRPEGNPKGLPLPDVINNELKGLQP